MRRIALMPFFGVFLAGTCACGEARPAPAEIPPNPVPAHPGIESGAWSLESWGNSGTTELFKSGGRSYLKVIYAGGGKDKSAFKHLTHFGAAADGKLRLNVYAPGAGAPAVSVALSTTPAYAWHESRGQALKAGWNALEIHLAAPNWKTEAMKWEFKAGVEHLDDIRAVDLLVFNGQAQTGWLLVEGLALDLDETGKKVAGFIEELKDTDPEKRAKAEADLIAIGRPALEALYQARSTDRPEVLLRASWAIRKIEAPEEEPPKDPEIRAQLQKQKEEAFFTEAKVRVEYLLKGMQNEREKLAQLVKEAREELVRARAESKSFQGTPDEDKKAYAETLEKLDRLSTDLQRAFEGGGEKKDGQDAAPPAPKK